MINPFLLVGALAFLLVAGIMLGRADFQPTYNKYIIMLVTSICFALGGMGMFWDVLNQSYNAGQMSVLHSGN